MPSDLVPAWDGDATPVSTSARRGVASWLIDNLTGERGRWPLWLPAYMGAGIGAYFWLTLEPPYWIAPAGLVLGGLACIATRRVPRFAGWLMPAAALAIVFFGFGLAQLQTWLVAAPVIEHRLGPVEITGKLVSVDPLPEGTRLVIAPSTIERLSADRTPVRIRVRLRHGVPNLIPGEWLKLRAVLMPPPGPAMPGAYDFQRRAWSDPSVGADRGDTHQRHRAHPRGVARPDRRDRVCADRRRDARHPAARRGRVPRR